MSSFVNIAAYKFVPLDQLAQRKAELLPLCRSLRLKGTILLSLEGINLFLSGTRESIDNFLKQLRNQPEFTDLDVKESLSDHQPFSRMLVRLKKEIISMGVESIQPATRTSPKLPARELKQWLDEGKPLTLYDVRNDYEVEVGTFANAIPAGIDHFRKFPEAAQQLPEELKSRPLVMFCTGGIRCEKAGPLMESQGFQEVYQLEGGILKYFEECGGEHYDGDCFVFDKRVAVNPALEETAAEQCYACQSIVTVEDQQSTQYQPPDSCPACYLTPEEKLEELLHERENELVRLTTPLPGNVAYNNIRPMNVPLRFDRQPLLDFLCGLHSHVDAEYWRQECERGRLCYQSQPLSTNSILRSGWRIEHLLPHTVEPDVSRRVGFLYEDDLLVAVNKPAPLPMHPCGRFNRNSLKYFLSQVYEGEQLRMLHRLDANTTGVVLFARKRSAGRELQPQFQEGRVNKTYLALVNGHPKEDRFVCSLAIGREAVEAGGRATDPQGLPAETQFQCLQRRGDGTSLVECRPITGRTNQIRIHLAALNLPIVGDPRYGSPTDRRATQTLGTDDPPMHLHAWHLEVQHPGTGKTLSLSANPPAWGREVDAD